MKLVIGILIISTGITAAIVAIVTADWRPLLLTAACLLLIRKA